MGIRRFDFIAIALPVLTGLTACEQIRRARECRDLSDVVNPALRLIDMERTTHDDAPAYERIAVDYQALAGKIVAARYSNKKLGDAVTEYARLLTEASNDARAYSEALAAKDSTRAALARAAAGRTAKRESSVLIRIESACTSR